MKLRARALGLAVGTVWGLGIFVATIWSTLLGGGKTLVLLSAYYYGYSVGYGGSIVGLFWGFVNGFIFGMGVAWCYNYFHGMLYRDKSQADRSAAVPTR